MHACITGILAQGRPAPEITIKEARARIDLLLADFRFASPSDRARAIAALVTPAMIFGGLLGGRAPLDLGEADDSQSGKGYRNKLTAAIYGQQVKTITQRKGGVGSLVETFSSALVAGAGFISIDNVRGTLDSPAIDSFLTEDVFFARIPYMNAMEIESKRVVVMMTSNKAELTIDLANRASCVQIRKQPAGYEFTSFPEGDLLEHVRSQPAAYLGAIFAAIREWHDQGKPQAGSDPHDFRQWAGILGWIVDNVFDAGPLLAGHRETQIRVANPALNWLRDVALVVERCGRLDQWLRAHEILDMIADEVELPGIPEDTDVNSENEHGSCLRALGRQFTKCFSDDTAHITDAMSQFNTGLGYLGGKVYQFVLLNQVFMRMNQWLPGQCGAVKQACRGARPDGRARSRGCAWWVAAVCCVLLCAAPMPAFGQADDTTDANAIIKLRAWGVPDGYSTGPIPEGQRAIMDAFRQRFPHINPVSQTGLVLPGGRTMDMAPFMQIAGDIAPDVLYVSYRQSQTYISMGLLYPLDGYIETLAGIEPIEDGHLLSTQDYIARLQEGPGWPRIAARVPSQCWEVMRRKSREGDGQHIYAYPAGPLVIGMMYNRLLFAEHADEGIEMRTPRDWEELLDWAKFITDPAEGKYGLQISITRPGLTFSNFLYAAGGNVVKQIEADEVEFYRREKNIVNVQAGAWVCIFDSEEAVDAAYFWARLRYEKVMRDGKEVCRGVIRASAAVSADTIEYGMTLTYLDDRFLVQAQDQTVGFGPVAAGPTGLQRSEFNSRMIGVFSGLADDDARRDAAWEYIKFYDGPEARRLRIEKLVEAGLGPFVRRKLLEQFNDNGRYDSVIRRISPDLERTYKIAYAGGVPEPYGKNCQYIYDEMRYPLEAIWNNDAIRDAIDAGDADAAKTIIRGILQRATANINTKMLGNLSPKEARQRNIVSWIVIALALGSFAVVMRIVLKAFTPEHHRELGGWQFGKYWKAYFFAGPALLLITMWMYWPMVKGTAIAFQDYSVMGDSTWVGASNFAAVLYDAKFWLSLKVSLMYALLFMIFGFCAPILLAFLLSEVPKGKILFRTIYYLPAVLTGLVVILMWKSFYGPDGMINQILNGPVWMINWLIAYLHLPVAPWAYLNEDWLQNPHWALFFCLLPTVWAGMGPGCLIYLAALKTVPEEIYEAADIDGAGIRDKVFHVAVPTIKIIVMINFIGAMIGAIRGSGGFVLAMTGGGPYTESGGATEVVGLKLFYTTFGYLQFGVGAAMAWVIGAMLIGFTVFQLKRLSNVEFRTAGGDN